MGYMRHHAIVVTGPLDRLSMGNIDSVHSAVREIAAKYEGVCDISPLTKMAINHYASFLVAPDGSKEGWDDSDKGDKTRDEIIQYLNSLRYGDGSSPFDFVEVQFGDDDKETKIIRHSDEMVGAEGRGCPEGERMKWD